MLLEQSQDALRSGIGDRQGLHTELLLDLQCLEFGTFLCEIGINQVAETLFEDINKLLCELCLNLDAFCR